MFPSSFFGRLDPFYRKELIKLQKKMDAIKMSKKPNKKILELLNDFSSNLLMPKQFWDEMIKIGQGYPNRVELAEISVFHLSYLNLSDRRPLHLTFVHDAKLWCGNERNIPRRLQPQHRDKKPLCIENFCYPHEDLEKKWKEYEENATAAIPRAIHRRYEKSKILHSELQSMNRKNFKEWFNTIAEAEDIEFVVQNVEYQIGQDLCNKTLWKLYIGYLQKNDQKKLLETYSKYCRFFIGDFEMFKEYQKTAEQFGPSRVPWKNTFDFEIYDKNVLCVFKTPTVTPAPSIASPCMIHFDVRNALPQKFPFHSNLMEYIIKNAKAEILFDLFKCCKWFFARYPFPICYKLDTSLCKKTIHQQSISTKDLSHLKTDIKIFVSSVFKSDYNSVTISEIISKIYRCTAKYVSIHYQKLSMNELKFLIGHGDVLRLNLSIKDQDGNQFAFEDILQLVPKVQKLEVAHTRCSENLSQYLCDFQFQNKIEEFRFGDVKILPEPNVFAEFMLKNASETYYSYFVLQGHTNGNHFGGVIWEEEDSENEEETEISRFKRIVNEIVYQQRSGNPRSSLSIY